MLGIKQTKVTLFVMLLLLGCTFVSTVEIECKATGNIISQSGGPVWLENISSTIDWNVPTFIMTVSYEFDFDDSERLVNATLYLSLDNASFSPVQDNEYDPSTAPAHGSGEFVMGDSPDHLYPFTISGGDMIWGYAEFESNTSVYVSDHFAVIVNEDYGKPPFVTILENLTSSPLGIIFLIVPIAIISYYWLEHRNN